LSSPVFADSETVQCLLCGTDEAVPLLNRKWPRHVVCQRCGLVYQNPRPTVAAILKYYESSYWEGRGDIRADASAGRSAASESRARAITEWTRGRIEPTDLVVEIGCGHGEIVSYIRDEFRCRTRGVEPSAAQAAAARQRYGLDVQVSDLDQASLDPNSIKLLILSHVAEHFHEPRKAFQRCADLLAADGLLFVEVPNILTPHPRKRLSTWLAVEHMYYFSPLSLHRLLAECGFSVEQSFHVGCVRFLARKSGDAPSPRPLNEYRAVKRAMWKHELRYWPTYAAHRLLQKVFPNSKQVADAGDD